jgi:hypothetical protein
MKFGSWTYDNSKVNLQFYRAIKRFDLSSYVESNEWDILENNASRFEEKYGKYKNLVFEYIFLLQIVVRRFMLI